MCYSSSVKFQNVNLGQDIECYRLPSSIQLWITEPPECLLCKIPEYRRPQAEQWFIYSMYLFPNVQFRLLSVFVVVTGVISHMYCLNI